MIMKINRKKTRSSLYPHFPPPLLFPYTLNITHNHPRIIEKRGLLKRLYVEEGLQFLEEKKRIQSFKMRYSVATEPPVEDEDSAHTEPKAKRSRKEFSEEEEQYLIDQVTAGVPLTKILIEGRDRKTVADHYALMRKRALAEGRVLPEPRRIYVVRTPPTTPRKVRTLEPKQPEQ